MFRLLRKLWLLLLISPLVFAGNSITQLEKEIALAKEAAPVHITKDANFMIWEENKFVFKIKGDGDFVCLVLRDDKGRYEPSCLNQSAMKSVLPIYEFQARELYKGKSINEIYQKISEKVASGEFPKAEPGALVYMMSPKNKFYDHFNNKLMDITPHVMLYYPKLKQESMGFNGQDGLPMMYDEYPHLTVVHIETNNQEVKMQHLSK